MADARVVLAGSLKAALPDADAVVIQAADIRQLLRRLGELYPELKDQLEEGVTVSIDGKIYNDAWFEPLPEDCEIYVLPRLAGG